MIKCPKCGHQNEDSAKNCANCHINLKWALENIEQFEAEARKAEQRAELERRKASLILTTTHSIEGRAIVEYLGVVTAEVVMGTGLLSELGAGVADLFGTRAGGFQNKLRESKSTALDELRNQAYRMGADAIVGVDLDYAVLANNVLTVLANGTAVKLAPMQDSPQD